METFLSQIRAAKPAVALVDESCTMIEEINPGHHPWQDSVRSVKARSEVWETLGKTMEASENGLDAARRLIDGW